MVSTPLENIISQNRNLPQIGVKIKKCLKPPPSNFMVLYFQKSSHNLKNSCKTLTGNHLSKALERFAGPAPLKGGSNQASDLRLPAPELRLKLQAGHLTSSAWKKNTFLGYGHKKLTKNIELWMPSNKPLPV